MNSEEWEKYYRQYGNPDHIPHYPDWPNHPHADWPHWRGHRWNDTEPAHEVPWDWDCCRPDESDCICVTSADADLWNSYSGLSALTGFEPDMIASAVSAYSALPDMKPIQDMYYDVSANSAVWNSAGYVPNVYENLSILFSAVNEKADASALSSFHVWTDSQKIAWEQGIPGDYSGTIYGDGTFDRPLRIHKNLAMAAMLVADATNNYSETLISRNDYNNITGDINELNRQVNNNQINISENRYLIELLINGMGSGYSGLKWVRGPVSMDVSRAHPDTMYYWQS